ncbi:MAG: N-acetylornithine carbamoyltransferase [Gammaproteobacteria bacterium]|nr:N-acetylornithine carbamoyltransferase [Gammaproteobacteria bacterium]NNM13163.1 N-acetylornithine carbamoyltransferase [Gammaproteobacteria bacterium]
MEKHFLSTENWSQDDLQKILDLASELKQSPLNKALEGKSIAMLFLNSSLRTRTSFEIGMQQLGGIAVVLQPGKDAWGIEFKPNVIMDGDAEEHIIEVAGVLSRYCDLIALRAFPSFTDWSVDRQDLLINALAQHSSVPVINMETIVHPCQELALMQTLQEKLGSVQNKKFVLTWAYHPKPLNTAVANSVLLIASKFGMDVTLLYPDQHYLLDSHYLDKAQEFTSAHGGSFTLSHDIESAYADADVVYAKSWGSLDLYGDVKTEQAHRQQYKHFTVDEKKMALTNNAYFSHCLPLRRNIQATDAVMDADYCLAIDEAENRLHVQKSLMINLLNN